MNKNHRSDRRSDRVSSFFFSFVQIEKTNRFKSSLSCAENLWKNEGLHSLYRGFVITIIRGSLNSESLFFNLLSFDRNSVLGNLFCNL